MIFDKFLIFIFNIFVYSGYRRKYKLGRDFKFNGYFIRIYGDGTVSSKKGSYVSYFSYFNVVKGTSITIGSNVSIAHNVKIYTSGINTHSLITKERKESVLGDVCIGSNVLIGSNTFICPGVNIGDNVVIGANSVVNKDIPSFVVAAGNPAKVRKSYLTD